MKIEKTAMPDVYLVEPTIMADDRGSFFESHNEKEFSALGIEARFVQDNQSVSKMNVLRGLHYQVDRWQGKLVRVVEGAIFDVAVDLRRSSKTFGQWVGQELSAANNRMLWIPEGFAHGFLSLTERAVCLYKATAFYSPEGERIIAWNDPTLAIAWPLQMTPHVSAKDQRGVSFLSADYHA